MTQPSAPPSGVVTRVSGTEADARLLAPVVVTLFHLTYGAILGAIYGKLIDTDEALEHEHMHVHR